MIWKKNTEATQNAAIQAVTAACTVAVLSFLQTTHGECQMQQAIYQWSLDIRTSKQRVTVPQSHQESYRLTTGGPDTEGTLDERTARIIAEAFHASTQNHDSEQSNQKLKLANPKTYDGKSTTPFRPWWESVNEFIRFFPQTAGFRRVIWVGTLLTNEALE